MIFCRYVLILQHIPHISRLYVFHPAFRQEFGRFCDNLPIEPDGVPSLPNVGLGSTIGFRKERAAVVAQWVCAGTRGSELSTYPQVQINASSL